MDNRCKFTTHFEIMKSELETVIGHVSRVIRIEWGLTKRVVRIFYRGLFVACATEGAPGR